MTIVFAAASTWASWAPSSTAARSTAAGLRTIVESTGPDGPDDGYPGPGPRLDASLELLHAVEVPAELAATVESLDFDGGNEIYMLIEQTSDIDTAPDD